MASAKKPHNQAMTRQFFSPESVIWRVDREMILLLAGGRALLMQIAHAKIAAGVAAHSRFQQDPLRRLRRTMNAMWSVVFDDIERARGSLRRVREIHEQVRGTLRKPDQAPTGLTYAALDPELLLWVHATLVDSALLAYEYFVRPLSVADKTQYYEETMRLARLFDVPEAAIPPSVEDFLAYVSRMVSGPQLEVSATAKSLARDVLHPRPWLLRPVGPLFAFITAGLLPAKLRAAYDLEWDERKEKWLHHLAFLTRSLVPWLPPPLRVAPQARAAEWRLKTPGL